MPYRRSDYDDDYHSHSARREHDYDDEDDDDDDDESPRRGRVHGYDRSPLPARSSRDRSPRRKSRARSPKRKSPRRAPAASETKKEHPKDVEEPKEAEKSTKIVVESSPAAAASPAVPPSLTTNPLAWWNAQSMTMKVIIASSASAVLSIPLMLFVVMKGSGAEEQGRGMHTPDACMLPNATQKEIDTFYDYNLDIRNYCNATGLPNLKLLPEIPLQEFGQGHDFTIPKDIGFPKEQFRRVLFDDHAFGCRTVVVYSAYDYHVAKEICLANEMQMQTFDTLMEACHTASDVINVVKQRSATITAIWLNSNAERNDDGTVLWRTNEGFPLGGPLKACDNTTARALKGRFKGDLDDAHLMLLYDRRKVDQPWGCVKLFQKRRQFKASFICKRCGKRDCDAMCGLKYPNYPQYCNPKNKKAYVLNDDYQWD